MWESIVEIMHYLREPNVLSILVRVLLAAVAGGVVGFERGLHGRAAGLRTHMLVCLGAALTALIGTVLSARMLAMGLTTDIQRTGAQVMSGIGFLGAGTILVKKGNSRISGLTTAAGLWATAAIGLAAGAGFYWGALSCAAVAMLTMTVLAIMEKQKKESLAYTRLYAELKNPADAGLVEDTIRSLGIPFESFTACPPHSGIPGHLGLEVTIFMHDRATVTDALQHLESVFFTVTGE